jgi:hypothetical protein
LLDISAGILELQNVKIHIVALENDVKNYYGNYIRTIQDDRVKTINLLKDKTETLFQLEHAIPYFKLQPASTVFI